MTEAERDESLRLFGHRPAEQEEARRWLQPWRRDTKRKPPEIKDLPVYDKVFQKFVEAMPIEKRLAALAPAQVLGAFAPAQRLAGLAPAPWILTLRLKVSRVHPEECLRSLPAEVQEQIRQRLQGAAQGGPHHLGPSTELPPFAPVFCLHPTLTVPPFGLG